MKTPHSGLTLRILALVGLSLASLLGGCCGGGANVVHVMNITPLNLPLATSQAGGVDQTGPSTVVAAE